MLIMEDIRVGYGRTDVIEDVTVEVPADGVAAVLGHNGAGKTTLLRAAVGLLRPRAGKVTFDGTEITKLPPHRRVRLGIAYVPQGQQCFGQLTVAENLRLITDGRRGAGRDEVLDMFPALRGFLDRRAGLLSGGQRQQLAIARALLTRPRLLILDEPTEGLQPSVVAEIETIIAGLAATDGLSVLLVEQQLGFALELADRYTVLASGRVTTAGPGGAAAVGAVRAALTI
ncbi:ATP-binding cassette domain-containing protein [Microlunatus sp. GCM10028923]|uniref:ATP-binding cassette domain-containing protein n=1 Tax=Microlunatus sp. GCM10028923 TaxID=3273400 RepID=UPI00362200C8